MESWVLDRIRAAKDQGAKSLDLFYAGLTKLPKELLALTNLTSLNLWSNSLGAEGARALSKLTNLTSLDLRGNSIGAQGAHALSKLTNLTSLNLESNRIGDEGARALSTLTNLTSLNLWSNSLGDEGARALSTLTNLTSLDLSDNDLGAEGARALSKLTNLTSLDLRGNSIGAQGAHALSKLTNLTSLNLESNRIGDEGAHALSKLTNLTSLNLESNRIGDEGARAILEAWSCLPNLKGRELDLRNNGDLSSLPKEVLNSTDAEAIIAAYRRFEEANRQGTSTPLNEAKLLVLGNAAVGKTSLLRYLIEREPRNPDEKQTMGTAIHERIETTDWKPSETSEMKLHVWDFGGQEIYRSTHRYFLTKRSLYLIVLDARSDEDEALEKWLTIVRNIGDDSPVIVVTNKCDLAVHTLDPRDEEQRQQHYPGVAFVRTSCNADEQSADSVQVLRELIVTTLASDERLKHVREPIPPSWLRVKSETAERARNEQVLPVREFYRLCEGTGRHLDAEVLVTKDAEQRALLRLLHDIGIIVACGLDRNSAELGSVTLLDPNWLTKALYSLMDNPDVRAEHGVFTRDQLPLILDTTDYPPERYPFILEIMQDDEIGLAFEFPGSNGRFLIPLALPRYEPPITDWPDALRLRYRYDHLPLGLIPRLIVDAHSILADPPARWKSGAMFQCLSCQTLVLSRGNQVDIRVHGPQHECRSAVDMMRQYMATIHERYKVQPIVLVPLPDQPEADVPYDNLIQLERERGPAYRFRPNAGRTYSVRELLNGEHDDVQPSSINADRSPSSNLLQPLTLSLGAVAATIVILCLPSIKSQAITAVLVGFFVLVYIAVVYFKAAMKPQFYYRRKLNFVIPGGFAANAIGFSLQANLANPQGQGGFQWDGTPSVSFNVAWIVAVVTLTIADCYLQSRIPPETEH